MWGGEWLEWWMSSYEYSRPLPLPFCVFVGFDSLQLVRTRTRIEDDGLMSISICLSTSSLPVLSSPRLTHHSSDFYARFMTCTLACLLTFAAVSAPMCAHIGCIIATSVRLFRSLYC
ncbi:hypothetical protein BDQ12DRAFT_692179 [Crucibulum laeve]|uniref:Uncharacterized protein n=1 Tax=Crucibulum laeve TaxID=68775 RepID=A0A5C3LIP0_9AGAR|nr:hypothetical protein BDQ12DRAFT_692179 [Crucibulum laeve]